LAKLTDFRVFAKPVVSQNSTENATFNDFCSFIIIQPPEYQEQWLHYLMGQKKEVNQIPEKAGSVKPFFKTSLTKTS